jgi:hypothetical protein
MMTNGGEPVRLAGMRLGLGPLDITKLVSNPSEITARLRYQQAFPRS